MNSADNTEALIRLLKLKTIQRKGWTRFPIPAEEVESVADHSYAVALLAWLMCPPELDRLRVLEIALIHDLAEAEVGDLTPSDGVAKADKDRMELEALTQLTAPFANRQQQCLELLQEYQEQSSPEARWVKKMDKRDMALQSLAYEAEHGVDLKEFRPG